MDEFVHELLIWWRGLENEGHGEVDGILVCDSCSGLLIKWDCKFFL